nr:hypothetical protein [uncultured Desulfobacter sp.]
MDTPIAFADRAATWLLKAQEATPDDGVSYGFFLDHGQMAWRLSYPETTGYIIPSLIEYGHYRKQNDIINRALTMAEWEAYIQMPSGAVQGGMVTSPDRQTAAVFNTGMVLQGWTAAFRETGNTKFLEAGRKAADFLMNDLDETGHYRSHGFFVSQNTIKTYNVLCSWALYRFGEDSGDDAYKKAALKNGEATLHMQYKNGWFENCCLTQPEKPLTHTLGYTLQGLLEIGVLAGYNKFVSAAEKGVKPLVQNIREDGYLSGRFDRNWKSKARYSCLTGSAQIAIVLYRLAQILNDESYSKAADQLVNFLKSLQLKDCTDSNMNGAIAGSFPLLGEYMTAGYPNWATKYFLDALLLQASRVNR